MPSFQLRLGALAASLTVSFTLWLLLSTPAAAEQAQSESRTVSQALDIMASECNKAAAARARIEATSAARRTTEAAVKKAQTESTKNIRGITAARTKLERARQSKKPFDEAALVEAERKALAAALVTRTTLEKESARLNELEATLAKDMTIVEAAAAACASAEQAVTLAARKAKAEVQAARRESTRARTLAKLGTPAARQTALTRRSAAIDALRAVTKDVAVTAEKPSTTPKAESVKPEESASAKASAADPSKPNDVATTLAKLDDVLKVAITSEEQTGLNRGDIAIRQIAEVADNKKLVGGVAYQQTYASVDTVWRALLDTAYYRRSLPAISKATLVSEKADGKLLRRVVELQHTLRTATYSLALTFDAGTRTVAFALDEGRKHDIVAARGKIRLESKPNGTTLITFAAVVEPGDGLIKRVLRPTMQEWLMRTPWQLRRYTDNERRRYEKEAILEQREAARAAELAAKKKAEAEAEALRNDPRFKPFLQGVTNPPAEVVVETARRCAWRTGTPAILGNDVVSLRSVFDSKQRTTLYGYAKCGSETLEFSGPAPSGALSQLDADGSLFAAYAGQVPDLGQNVFIKKIAADPAQSWSVDLGGDGHESTTALALSPNGVLITGTTNGQLPGQTPATRGQPFLARYDLKGKRQWIWQEAPLAAGAQPPVEGWPRSRSRLNVASDPKGNAYASYDGLSLLKLDTKGKEQWRTVLKFENDNRRNKSDARLSADASGVYAIGTHNNGWNYIVHADAAGRQQWVRMFKADHKLVIDKVEGTEWNGTFVGPMQHVVQGAITYVVGSYQNTYRLGSSRPKDFSTIVVYALDSKSFKLLWQNQYRVRAEAANGTPDALGRPLARPRQGGGLVLAGTDARGHQVVFAIDEKGAPVK